MENTENQEVIKPSNRLRDRYSKKFPDRAWEGENAESDDSVNNMAADELEEYDRDRESRQIMDDKMNKMFEDKRSARSFVRMANGEDPAIVLVEEFGPEFLEALESEEGKAKFKDALDKWKEQDIQNEISQEEFDANMGHSTDAMAAFGEKNGLDDEQVGEIVSKLYSWCESAIKGEITEEMLTAVLKAGKYDNAVAEAREEGEINGRNEKIKEKLRTSKSNPSGLPQNVSSKAEPEEGRKSKGSTTGSLAMFGGIPVRKKN